MTMQRKEKWNVEKRELILMNLIWNVDSRQTEKKMKSMKDNIYCENCNIVIAYTVLPKVYSEPYQRSKMECFVRIVSLHLRCLARFWIRFWMLKSFFFAYVLLLHTRAPWFKRRKVRGEHAPNFFFFANSALQLKGLFKNLSKHLWRGISPK